MAQEFELPEPYAGSDSFEVVEMPGGSETIRVEFDDIDEAKAHFDRVAETSEAILIVRTWTVYATQGIIDARGVVSINERSK